MVVLGVYSDERPEYLYCMTSQRDWKLLLKYIRPTPYLSDYLLQVHCRFSNHP
ncbi:unnamed protein product [Schistosoma margrebowiei]|uniref:Uncharacterized protein n=1 Tax=Schistosoma margrebowiei TaxID=48269 RepID=A0A183N945_9TREM|nr:unnamed protein product [Schistosoma margrebowiei]